MGDIPLYLVEPGKVEARGEMHEPVVLPTNYIGLYHLHCTALHRELPI